MENNNQQNKEADKIYTAGEVGSLLESINDGIRVIAEDQSSVKRDIKEIKSDVNVMKSDIVDIKSDIVDIKSDIQDMKVELKMKAEKEIVDKHETRIVKLEKTALANG